MRDRIAEVLAKRTKSAVPLGDEAGEGGERGGEGHREPPLMPAAVLLPLFEKDSAIHVLLTRRTEEVGAHRGQISFPGGRRDDGDRSLLQTALRECEEEIGVPASSIQVLGELDDLVTVTDFIVSPYVGLIPYPYPLRVSHREIAEIIEIPLATFLEPERLRVSRRMEYRGKPHVTYFFDIGPHVVWGVTARILLHLLEIAFGYRPPREER
jgi:8-oxo-dGTP pyrophosphatase MutT (NUDIX family)